LLAAIVLLLSRCGCIERPPLPPNPRGSTIGSSRAVVDPHARCYCDTRRIRPQIRSVEDARRSDPSKMDPYPMRRRRLTHIRCVRCVCFIRENQAKSASNRENRIYAQIRRVEDRPRSDASKMRPDPMRRRFVQIRRVEDSFRSDASKMRPNPMRGGTSAEITRNRAIEQSNIRSDPMRRIFVQIRCVEDGPRSDASKMRRNPMRVVHVCTKKAKSKKISVVHGSTPSFNADPSSNINLINLIRLHVQL